MGAVHDLAKKIAGVSKDGDIIFSRKVLEILSADQEFRFNGDRENLLPELMEGGNCFP